METQVKKGFVAELKEFLANPGIMNLAVAVVIGIAFGTAVAAMVEGILMPLVAAIVGQPSFDALTWTINGSTVLYGTFLSALANFLIVGTVMFTIVRAVTKVQSRRIVDLAEEEAIEEPNEETLLLTEIRDLLSQRSMQR